jgi:anti-anti-sigma factor
MDEPRWELNGTDGEILVVRVPPSLSHETAEPVRACVERRLPNRERCAVVLDMSEVVLISSVGVTALLQIEELASAAGGAFRLAGLSERGRSFLAMLKLDERFPSDASVGDAIARLTADRG